MLDGHWLWLHLISKRLPKQLELGGNDYIFLRSHHASVSLVHRKRLIHKKKTIHKKMIAIFSKSSVKTV